MDLSLVFVLANPSQSHTRTTGMMSRVLTVVLLAMVAPVRAAIVKGTGILKELGRRPIANVQIVDSAHTCGPWATTLNNLGSLDSEQGRMDEAHHELVEALQIYRELAEKNPETLPALRSDYT